MAKERTKSELTKVSGVEALLKYSQDDKSLSSLNEYVIVPFVKIIQGQTDQTLKDTFGEGSAILRPGDSFISKREEKFHFVPLFFYTQFRKWGDRKDTQMIYDTSYDPTSVTAKKSRDAKQWSEVYEEDINKSPADQRKFRYVEHLCFVGTIYGAHPLSGTQCLISFQKGDFFKGRSFATGISMRKQEIIDGENKKKISVPLWAQVWQFTISKRTKNGNSWWGFDTANPDEGVSPMITADEFESFCASYTKLAEAFKANLLVVDGDDSGIEEVEESGDF